MGSNFHPGIPATTNRPSNPDIAYAASYRAFYRSEDGGDSFRRVETPVEVLLNEAALMPDGRVVVVGIRVRDIGRGRNG